MLDLLDIIATIAYIASNIVDLVLDIRDFFSHDDDSEEEE